MPKRLFTVVSTFVMLVAAGVGTADDAWSQLPTTVQLPSFSSFSYRGTVVVPVRGSAYLGGNSSSASGLRRRGLSRGFGSSFGTSQASVSATIIDHQEIDRQLLGADPKEFVRRQPNAKKADPVEEGKALVHYARKLYREGKRSQSFEAYQMAIRALPPGLSRLARKEFERVFGTAATQALQMASLRR
ncbi:MAG: hypothetical protein MI861_13060 [Pirellulales bacterium]|nr:hypothetical protein [Pirellulales bacterium]